MSLNPNPTHQNHADVNVGALRFNRQGELHWQQWQDERLQSEPVAKLLQQGRITRAQLLAFGVIWVPTELLVLTEVTLPAKRRAEIDAALPFAMEEQLAQPVESYHFVILDKQVHAKGAVLQVAAVARTQMQAWIAAIKSLNLDSLVLVADCFALPLHKGQAVCLTTPMEGGISLCRTGQSVGVALPAPVLTLKGLEHAESVQWSQALWAKAAYSALQWRELSALNLRIGEFSAQQRTQIGKLWLWPNLAAGVLMVTMLGSLYLSSQQALQDAQAYQVQSEQLFRAMFPEVKRVVNLKAQTLSRLQPAAEAQNAQLMPLIYQLEPLLTQADGVLIDEIRWNQSRATLQLKVRALQSRQLQLLEPRLANINGKLSINSVTPEAALGVIDVVAN
ncbi:hypothetical protein THMIRHAS_04280 [Thiosulfatimonas sediminis]|uniref:Type II secretion system protein L n=1 Tax=Thiosulfatimonas sediminis TaxID=2675054 RepID=A0A6F8PSG1_9GAMM|nr:type II secretion system protein GspL [Thiosulfatimonas sediminis]BBP45055.1 hypothetical protein THMIRHAS_04280 [Thiosulfatimonas sediminis]